MLKWRRGWDSNPRGARPPTDFESAPVWPLRYLSAEDAQCTRKFCALKMLICKELSGSGLNMDK